MATETDAARERVLVARDQLGDELALLEASARSAVDIPAKVKASPAKAAAVAGTGAFLVLGGPRRVLGGVKRVMRGGKAAPLPKSMLPDEIEKTLKHLGSDGDAIRGSLERDFADYAKSAAKSRKNLRTIMVLAVARPLLLGGSRAASRWLFSSGEQEGFDERLAKVRERLEGMTGGKSAGEAAAAAATSAAAAAKPKTGSLRDDAEDVSGV